MAAAKRIFQIAKEFERDEKEIIAFLTAQGIKVGNRLSAVSEEAYNLLKAKFTAPPEPEPVPEPAVKESAPAESSDAAPDQADFKKKKKKKPQNQNNPADGNAPEEEPQENVSFSQQLRKDSYVTQKVSRDAVKAGNEFISQYHTMSKKEYKANKPRLSPVSDAWAIIQELKTDSPDSAPVRYWQAVNKLATKAFKLLQRFGLENREALAEMRETMNPLGATYAPREIFTDEENQKFEAQQKFLFATFGHGMGAVNDRLFDMKFYAEHMKAKYEHMNFVEYLTNPEDELRSKDRVPFNELAEAVIYIIRGVARRFAFYNGNKERIAAVIENFFGWLDGYAKLKEQGADAAKLEKYLELEEKLISLIEFMAFDNLLEVSKKFGTPYDTVIGLLNEYRDNMDDPDAERNFQYKVRGVTNIIYKPKEYVFLYRFAGLVPQADYRPPEEPESEEQENPDAEDDEA